MSGIKQYDTETRLEAVMGSNHYGSHVHAMTAEKLHSKSDIAVELAWRDMKISDLLAKLEAANKEISDWRSIAEAAAQDDADWHKLTDSKNEVISQIAQGIIQLKESVEQNVKALNRVAHQRDKAFADIEAAEARLLVPWIQRSEKMPDPKDKRRVCVFTPNPVADLRYRLVPANLFKAVCSSATHWHYVDDPVEGGE